MQVDIVIPFFNEQDCVDPFLSSLMDACARESDIDWRFYLIDDGSIDNTVFLLDQWVAKDKRCEVVHLWGNHGHQKALVAGLDRAKGDAALLMDGDGQHPPDVAIRMVKTLIADPSMMIVQAIRRGRQGSWFKELTSHLFYRIVNMLMPDAKLESGASDFRVLRRPLVERLRCYPDRYRNLRVLLASLRLSTCYVDYDVEPRIAGHTHYSFRQMLRLAVNGWFAFSVSPLRLSLLLMFGTGMIGIIYSIYGVWVFIQQKTVPGWTSIIAFLAFMFCALFGVLAILAEYMARIYEDVRKHPVYYVTPRSCGPVEANEKQGDGADACH